MHTPSIYLATVAVLATIASAEADRPKFYFPRQVKRQQFANTTTTPEKAKQDPFTSSFSTKRSLTDFLSGLTSSDSSSPSSSGTTGNILDSVVSPLLPTSSADEVTTIHFQTTKFVEPTTEEKTSVRPTSRDTGIDLSNLLDPIIGSTGVLPPVTVQPTTSNSADSTEATPSSASGSAITFGPDGIVTSDSTSDSATTDGLTGPGTGTRTSVSTDDGIFPGLGSILSTLFDPTSTTAPPSSATDASATETVSSEEPGTTNILSSILGSLSLSNLLPTTSGVEGPGTTAGVTTTEAPVPTTTAESTNPLGSILSSILDPVTSSGSDIVTIVTPTLPPIDTSTPTTLPPISTPTVAPGNGTEVSTPTPTGTDITTSPTDTTTPPPPPITTPPITTTADVPGNGTVSTPTVTPTDTPTSLPTGNGTETTPPTGPISTPTISPTISLPTATNGTESIPTTSVPGSSVVPPSTTATPPATQPPSSIIPTGTNSDTSMWLPSSIIVASSPTLPPGVSATLEPTGIPSQLPRVINSPNGTEGQPEGMTLIQLGFVYQLNWKWVAENSITANQIFEYLPMGLRRGLGLKQDQVTMQSLLPLDTSAQLNYVTTLAMAYIPDNMVDTLALDLHAPLSGIYTNPDSSVNQLMNYIDPSIPLRPGSQLEGEAATGTGVGSSPTGSPGGKNGVFDTNDQNTSPKVRSTTVGIAVTCVGAAAAYGAAMFFIARRYKRKKQNHRRSSSITSNSEMRQSSGPALLGGGNFMTGGRTSPGDYSYGTNNNRNSGGSRGSAPNSARTQQISGPMMAENSLGWN